MLPHFDHFFIVGGQRCGTTYLCHLMEEHPAIEMAKPFRPEPKFFLREPPGPNGLTIYESTFFRGKPGAHVRGEKSTSYMDSRDAARRIAACFPRAKIILVVRDPIERAMSHYWLSVENGFESLPMDEAFRREKDGRDDFDSSKVSVSPFAYLSRGLYINTLTMYEEFFPAESISIVLYEEMIASVEAVQRVYHFVGVDAGFSPAAAGMRINEGAHRSRELPREIRKYVAAYFEESNSRLAERLGKNLALWWQAGSTSKPGRREVN